MKNIRKINLLFALLLGGALALTGCREDEELNLAGMPATQIGLSISEAPEDSPAMVNLSATYDAEGKIVVDGAISRVYTVALASPSLEEVSFDVEPIIANIPADKVAFSEKHLIIPAGHRSASVTVTLTDEDFSFTEDVAELPAKVYELGVKLTNIQGNLTDLASTEAKVVIDKESYRACVRLVGENGNTAAFERSCFNGQVLGGDELKYSFKAVLDRPAHADVTVDIVPSGLDEQGLKTMQITPSQLTIPAGETESTESAVWTMTDEIMTGNDDPYQWNILLTPTVTSTDEFVSVEETSDTDVVTLTVDKAINAVRPMESLDDLIGARVMNRAAWTADIENSGVFFDGSRDTYWEITDTQGTPVTIDLGREYDIAALRVGSNSSYNMRYITGDIAISKDGEAFGKIGRMDSSTSLAMEGDYYRVVSFYGTVRTRYLRLTLATSYSWYNTIAEIDIYEGDTEPVVYTPVGDNNEVNGKIAHTPIGSFSGVDVSFFARTNMPSDNGYTVNVAVDNSLVASYNAEHGTAYQTLEDGYLQLDNVPARIAAKAYKSSEAVKVSLTGDVSALTEANGYLVPLRLTSSAAASSAKQGVVWLIITPENSYFMSNPTADQIKGEPADRSSWTVRDATAGTDLGRTLFDGDDYSCINSSIRSVIFDLQRSHNIQGLRFMVKYGSYGGSYDVKKIRISVSDDDTSYTIIGEVDNNYWYMPADYYDPLDGQHMLVTYGVISARYVKLELLEVGSYFYGLADFDVLE